jgi:uracil-DNA glycosylase
VAPKLYDRLSIGLGRGALFDGLVASLSLGALMSNTELAKRLTDTLRFTFSPTLFNPWRDHCADCEPDNDPEAKLARLAAHLACVPKFILCGEAPSYSGCRHSGIAFTSERLLLEKSLPRISPLNDRLTNGANPYSERSATIVWNELFNLGIQEHTILWNALQMHPHELEKPYSNRTPTSKEIEIGKPALLMLVEAFPSATVVAVGKKAEGLLARMKVSARSVRHPSYGGAPEFRQQLKLLVEQRPS